MMPFGDGKLDVSVGGRLFEELVLGDESREKFGQHLAFGRRRFLNVEQEIAMIDHHDDALVGEACLLNGGGKCSREFRGGGDGNGRAPGRTGGGACLKLAVKPADA